MNITLPPTWFHEMNQKHQSLEGEWFEFGVKNNFRASLSLTAQKKKNRKVFFLLVFGALLRSKG